MAGPIVGRGAAPAMICDIRIAGLASPDAPTMPQAADIVDQLSPALHAPLAGVRVGIDTVSVAAITESLDHFSERFMRRLFTAREAADARAVHGGEAMAERLAARFAAKEAVIKALDLPEAGIAWPEIELTRSPAGRPAIALHGRAARLAQDLGVRDWAVSISHERDHACAVVVALLGAA